MAMVSTILHANVYVKPEDHESPCGPLEPVDEYVEPILVGNLLLGQLRERMRPGTGEIETELVAHSQKATDAIGQLSSHFADIPADVGIQLDRRLDQLRFDVLRVAGPIDDLLRSGDEVLRLGSEYLQLELDTERRVR